MPVNVRTFAYLAFFAFCVLSSTRDVLSEVLFKHGSYSASPVFVLFVYSVVTQAVAALILLIGNLMGQGSRASLWSVKNELLWSNIFTLMAFSCYFFAIQSPLGAAI